MADISKKLPNKIGFDTILKILKQILKHSACCPTGRYELQHLMSFVEVLLPSQNIFFLLHFGGYKNTLFARSGSDNIERREACLESVHLLFCLLKRDAVLLELLDVGG